VTARGLSIDELARRNPMRHLLPAILVDEERRGHVERVDGRWRPTASFVRDYGRSFSDLGPITTSTERRQA
jgi:hypothetical protein